MTTRHKLAPTAVWALVALAACGGSDTDVAPTTAPAPATSLAPATNPTATAGPTAAAVPGTTTPHAAHLADIPDDLVVVSGTATCDVLDDGGTAPDGTPGTVYLCELSMSDPRVSGTQRDDRWNHVAEGGGGFAWIFEESVITNEDGTWRGAIQAADDSSPCGEAHYIGEEAYEGLEFHYYFCDVGDPVFRGWISGGDA